MGDKIIVKTKKTKISKKKKKLNVYAVSYAEAAYRIRWGAGDNGFVVVPAANNDDCKLGGDCNFIVKAGFEGLQSVSLSAPFDIAVKVVDTDGSSNNYGDYVQCVVETPAPTPAPTESPSPAPTMAPTWSVPVIEFNERSLQRAGCLETLLEGGIGSNWRCPVSEVLKGVGVGTEFKITRTPKGLCKLLLFFFFVFFGGCG